MAPLMNKEVRFKVWGLPPSLTDYFSLQTSDPELEKFPAVSILFAIGSHRSTHYPMKHSQIYSHSHNGGK